MKVLLVLFLLIPLFLIPAFAQEPRPQQEGVYYQKQSDGKYHEVWNFPSYRCQPDCKLTIALDKQPRSELGEENPHYQLGETVSMRIILFDIEYFGSDSVKSLDLNIWGNTHVKETMEIKPEEPLIFEYKIGDDFNIGEYKIFGIAGGMNQELFFTVDYQSIPFQAHAQSLSEIAEQLDKENLEKFEEIEEANLQQIERENELIRSQQQDSTQFSDNQPLYIVIGIAVVIIIIGIIARASRKQSELESLPESLPRRGWTDSQHKEIMGKQGGVCANCGEHSGSFQFDHIDGNSNNNDMNNAQGLCPNCHDRKSRGLDES